MTYSKGCPDPMIFGADRHQSSKIFWTGDWPISSIGTNATDIVDKFILYQWFPASEVTNSVKLTLYLQCLHCIY